MKQGDKLFLFTDGVTEAQDIEGKLFGEEALEQVLSCHRTCDAEGLINAVTEAVNTFVQDAEQADDITMLTLEINS